MMKKWIVLGLAIGQIASLPPSGSDGGAVAKCPIELKPFTEEQCETLKTLSEEIKKKQEKVNKCHKEGAGEVEGAKALNADNNANNKTVTEETTKNLKNCGQCFSDIFDNITKECSEFSPNRKMIQIARIDTQEKHKKLRQIQIEHLTHSASANKARKRDGSLEEKKADNRAHERIAQARIYADTNTITETGVGNVTYLKKEGERVDSSVMTAFKFYQWLRTFSIFG